MLSHSSLNQCQSVFFFSGVLGPYYGGAGPSGIGTGVLPGAKPQKAPG